MHEAPSAGVLDIWNLIPVVTLSSFPIPCICGESVLVNPEGITYYRVTYYKLKHGFDIFLLLPSEREGANNCANTGVYSPSYFSSWSVFVTWTKECLLTRLVLWVSACGHSVSGLGFPDHRVVIFIADGQTQSLNSQLYSQHCRLHLPCLAPAVVRRVTVVWKACCLNKGKQKNGHTLFKNIYLLKYFFFNSQSLRPSFI